MEKPTKKVVIARIPSKTSKLRPIPDSSIVMTERYYFWTRNMAGQE